MSLGTMPQRGAFVDLDGKDEKSRVSLEIDEIIGPRLIIVNKGKTNVLQAGVSDTGSGVIETRDKHGYKTGRLP